MLYRLLPVSLVAVVALAGCGSSGPASVGVGATPGTPAVAVRGADGIQRVTIDATDSLVFTPNVVQAHVGTIAITMKIVGSTPHTLTFDDLHQDTGYVAGHASKTLTLAISKAGTFSFDCDYHPYMTGKLIVVS